MLNNDLFKKFCRERNISKSTATGYESALKHYITFHHQSMDELIQEAKKQQNQNIPLNDRCIKKRLLEYRSHLLQSKYTQTTAKTYFTKIKTYYKHHNIEIPPLPEAKYKKTYQTNYLDLPSKQHIQQACDNVSIDLKAIILFMASSGTAKAETLSLTINQFIQATKTYHHGGSISTILKTLSHKKNVVPTFYLKRIKTDKYYYTFCTPEATQHIIKYLQTRKNLKPTDKLFDFTHISLLNKFRQINDNMDWGYKGKYRFFRAHTLRKYHASNIGLSAEYIDQLQGRTKTYTHETYIKTNPEKLKKIYTSAMDNVTIYNTNTNENTNQEFTIVINIFLSGKEYNIR